MRFILFITILFVALTTTACGFTTTTGASSYQEQQVDGLTIGLEASEDAAINTAEEFIITLTDASGAPVEGADVYLDLTMPAMPMGSNRPVAEPLGEGRYRAETAYTMSGAWEIAVIANVEGVEHRVVFERDVAE